MKKPNRPPDGWVVVESDGTIHNELFYNEDDAVFSGVPLGLDNYSVKQVYLILAEDLSDGE